MRTLLITSLLVLAGCTAEEVEKTPPPAHDHAHTYAVKCGCAIEGVGKCGNFIEVDGKFVPLVGDLGLGKMEFCKKDGLMADVEGEVVDGKFVATSFKYHAH